MLTQLPARQVHLDFHTSEHIPGVGAKFSKKQWQQALKLGHVNSVTIFAKCHHSWSYYPTKVGQTHPTLKIDLMGQQIEACHEIGVRCPIYYTVGWSATDALTHPEWRAVRKDGSSMTTNIWGGAYDLNAGPETPKPPSNWIFMCPSGEYRQLMLDQTREICQRYAVDGFFYDICNAIEPCHCERCKAGMTAAGLDLESQADGDRYTEMKWVSFAKASKEIIHQYHPEATVFWNGQAGIGFSEAILSQPTHHEMEDLPTVWGGYDKFPPRARYFLKRGKPILGMSGKFHTSWGEFGGFKHRDAIRYEVAAMVAYGSSCSIGDQLHPNGVMDLSTYRNIGHGYKYVKQIEGYGLPSTPAADLAILTMDGSDDLQGVANMLMETQLDFVVAVPSEAGEGWSRHQTIVVPGQAVSQETAAALNRYVAGGGSLVVVGPGLFDATGKKMQFDVGAEYVGPATYRVDYTVTSKAIGKDLVESPFFNYTSAPRVAPLTGSKAGTVLATIEEPYFDRTYGHYCSHQNTPNRPADTGHAAVIQKGRIVYLAHRLGEMYLKNGARVHRDLFVNALRRVYKRPKLETVLPSAGRATILHQPDKRRYVVHLLYAPPLQRGRCLVIEDLPVLHDVAVAVRVPEKIRRVTLPLDKKKLAARKTGGTWRVTVPRMQSHQMVVWEY